MTSETEREIKVNGETRPWRGDSLEELLVELGMNPSRGGLAIAVNARIVIHENWPKTIPKPGDRVEIVTVFKGG